MDKLNIPDVPYEINEIDCHGAIVRTSVLDVKATTAYVLILSKDDRGEYHAVIKDRDLTTEDERDYFKRTLRYGTMTPPNYYGSFDEFRETYEQRFVPDGVNIALQNMEVELIEDVPKARTIPSIESLSCDGEFYTVVWDANRVKITRLKLNPDGGQKDIEFHNDVITVTVDTDFAPMEFCNFRLNSYDLYAISFRQRGIDKTAGIIVNPRIRKPWLEYLSTAIKGYYELGFVDPMGEMIRRRSARHLNGAKLS